MKDRCTFLFKQWLFQEPSSISYTNIEVSVGACSLFSSYYSCSLVSLGSLEVKRRARTGFCLKHELRPSPRFIAASSIASPFSCEAHPANGQQSSKTLPYDMGNGSLIRGLS